MATTSAFGWETPDDTDLVKDGAAAIRTLGNSIDTSMAELKGGTTNQVLAKNSNTDMDFKWVADASGIPATILDAKGDLIAATAADTASRLAVGANGTVLTADSAEATGLKWATPASGSTYVGVSVFKSTDQSISNSTLTAISFDSESFDTDGFHSNSTNTTRLTVPTGKGGKYSITGAISYAGNSTGIRNTSLYKNGSVVNFASQIPTAPSPSGTWVPISYVLNLVAGDYVEIFAFQNSGGSLIVYSSEPQTSIQMSYLGA